MKRISKVTKQVSQTDGSPNMTALDVALQNYDGRREADNAACSPTTRIFLEVLDDYKTPLPNKVFPPEIFTEFMPTVGIGAQHTKYRGKLPPYSTTFVAVKFIGVELCDDETAERLSQIEHEIRALYAEMQNFSTAAANLKFHGQTKMVEGGLLQGRVPDVDTLSREDIHEDFARKRNAIEAKVKALAREARELVAPIITNARKHMRQEMADIEVSERLAAFTFDIPWHPSLMFKIHAAFLLKVTIDQLGNEVYPSSMLAGLPVFNFDEDTTATAAQTGQSNEAV